MRFHVGLSMPFGEAAVIFLIVVLVCLVAGYVLASRLRA